MAWKLNFWTRLRDGSAISIRSYTGYLSEAIGNTADDVILAQLKGGQTYSIL